METLNDIKKSRLGAIIILLLAALGVIIGLTDMEKYKIILVGSSAFLIGMIVYCYYLGKEEVKRREENTRRKLK